MSNAYRNQTPPYPEYAPTRFSGDLPGTTAHQPRDLGPFGYNPAYTQYIGTRGRFMAGVGATMDFTSQMSSADPGIKDYPNELDVLNAADDTVGNGLFDPAGSHGNVHPDYGVFADHQALPGYISRERYYAASEVIDLTTGDNVMYVPSGAVQIDPQQRQALFETLQWTLPKGITQAYDPMNVLPEDAVVPYEGAWPIGQSDDQEEGFSWAPFVMSAAAGLAIGMFAALVTGK